jgi:hypothetical protein
VVGVAFLQGNLRFPQRFWMVICGEFVVVRWWKRGWLGTLIQTLKISTLSNFIF